MGSVQYAGPRSKESTMCSSFKVWGVNSSECELTYPCDRFMDAPDEAYFRGVTIYASPEQVFRWLCQMRVAPYSYDYRNRHSEEVSKKE